MSGRLKKPSQGYKGGENLGSIEHIVSFAVVIVAGWLFISFVKSQQLGWALFAFVAGSVSLAWINDIGGFQDAMGNFFSEVMKSIANDAKQKQ